MPRHALLGVSTRPSPDAVGALVMAVEPGSGADRGGIEVGDVIVGFADDEVGEPSELVAAIARHRPGDEITVTVERDGRERTLTVTLGARDETPS